MNENITTKLIKTKMPPNAKLLYSEICENAGDSNLCFMTNGILASKFKASTRSVSNWIKSLENNGYIAVKYVGQRRVMIVL